MIDETVKPKITATYPYTDESENIIYEVVRIEPGPNGKKKTFRQRMVQPDGSRTWGLTKECRRVLWHLSAVMAASEVWLCCGEKDASTAIELGQCGTTNSGGEATKWIEDDGSIPEWVKVLSDKDIVLFPDQDDAGRAHAENVILALQQVGVCSLAVVNVPRGKDLTEFMKVQGGTNRELNGLIEIAKLPENAPAKKLQKLVREKGQPAAIESEKIIIGAMLTGSLRLAEIDQLSADDFFMGAHKTILSAITEVTEKGACDRSAVADCLEERGKLEEIGGLSTLIDLTEDLPSAYNIEYHIERVSEKSTNRTLIGKLSKSVERLIGGESPETVREELESSIKNASVGTTLHTSSVAEIVGIMEDFLAPIKNGIMCKPLKPIFDGIRGLREGQLVVVGARPGHGKSSLMSLICAYSALQGAQTDILSLEVSKKECLLKMACIVAKVPMTSVIDGTLTDRQRHRIQEAIKRLEKLPLRIDDSSNWNIAKIRNYLRRRASQGKSVRLLAIDYLQLMNIPHGSQQRRDLEIGVITRGLKQLSIEFGLTIILLSQLNREGEKMGRLPALVDLRESGSIEQDADLVMLLWQDLQGDSEYEHDRKAKIIVAKQRNGGNFEEDVLFSKPYTLFWSQKAVERPDHDNLLN